MIYEIIEEIENKISELNDSTMIMVTSQEVFLTEAKIEGLEIALKIIKK